MRQLSALGFSDKIQELAPLAVSHWTRKSPFEEDCARKLAQERSQWIGDFF